MAAPITSTDARLAASRFVDATPPRINSPTPRATNQPHLGAIAWIAAPSAGFHIQSICHDLILVDEPGAVVSRSGDQPRRRRRRHLSRSRPTLPIRTMRHPRKRRTIASVLLRNWNSDLGIPSTATFVGSVNVTLRRSLRLIFMSRRHCTSFALETTGSRRNERDQIQTKR